MIIQIISMIISGAVAVVAWVQVFGMWRDQRSREVDQWARTIRVRRRHAQVCAELYGGDPCGCPTCTDV